MDNNAKPPSPSERLLREVLEVCDLAKDMTFAPVACKIKKHLEESNAAIPAVPGPKEAASLSSATATAEHEVDAPSPTPGEVEVSLALRRLIHLAGKYATGSAGMRETVAEAEVTLRAALASREVGRWTREVPETTNVWCIVWVVNSYFPKGTWSGPFFMLRELLGNGSDLQRYAPVVPYPEFSELPAPPAGEVRDG